MLKMMESKTSGLADSLGGGGVDKSKQPVSHTVHVVVFLIIIINL